MIPELVTIHTSLLTDLGDAVRERFGVSGELTIEEMKNTIYPYSPLPSGYTEIPYIGVNGTQYIDTGVTDEGDIEIDSKYTVVSVSYGECPIFSTWNSTNGYWNLFINYQYGTNLYVKEHHENSVKLATGVEYDLNLKRDGKKFTYTFVNVSAGNAKGDSFTSYQTLSANSTTIKMGVRGDGQGGSYSERYGRTHIIKGGTEARFYIPCTRNSDSVAGMYDIINGQFYTNAGTGTFITP